MELLCPWEPAQFLIYSSNVPALLYYSHVPAMVLAVIIGCVVFWNSKRSRTGGLLLVVTLLFFLWSFFDLILYATNRPDMVMFFWSLQILFEPLIYLIGFYLAYSFTLKQEPAPAFASFLFLLYIPVVIFLSTRYSLSGVNLTDCTAVEGVIALYYTYIVELFATFATVGLFIFARRLIPEPDKRKEARMFSLGILLFFTAFSWGNLIGSFSSDWVLAQVGLVGMPIFIAFLAFLIVRFRSFNVKLVGAQVLIVSLVALIGSQFFYIRSNMNRILTAVMLVVTGVIGINLIRSVRKEIHQREQIEKQEKELEIANARLKELDQLKSEFVSLATHQIRGPLAAIKGYASMIREGDYGIVSDSLKAIISTIYDSSDALAGVVQDFLDISRIEQGRMKYDFADLDFSRLVTDVTTELRPNIENKKLAFSPDVEPNVTVHADAGKLRQVVENLIDNALKYTPNGSIALIVKRTGAGTVRMTIKDTGVGIRPDVLPKLFRKFSRAEDASKANLRGTGLGLYVARQLIEAQKGRVWAESEGEGKGSTFIVELPLKA